MRIVDGLLDEYRRLASARHVAESAMVRAQRLFDRIRERTGLDEDRAYALAGVNLAGRRAVAALGACGEALERMRAFDAQLTPAGVLTVDRVMVWAAATGAFSDHPADVANSNRPCVSVHGESR